MRTRGWLAVAVASLFLTKVPVHAAVLLEPSDITDVLETALSQTITFSVPGAKAGESLGSGVVYDKRGYLLTCAHVVEDQARAKKPVLVTFRDGETTRSTAIFLDKATDLAMVQVAPEATKHLSAPEIGDADGLKVGSTVYVVGSPFGLEDSVSKGILSAKRRRLELNEYENFLQTDAAVNPGNSGGPLFDENGKLVAIVAAIKSKSGANSGVSFAISSRLVRPVAEGLVAHGAVKRAYLGLRAESLTPTEKREKNLKNGAKITAIPQTDSPAYKAGLRVGDIALKVDQLTVLDAADFVSSIAHAKPGEVLKIEVQRDGKVIEIEARPTEKGSAPASVAGGKIVALGVRVEPVTEAAALLAGYRKNEIPAKGLIVLEVDRGSAAAASGLATGTILVKAESTALATAADLDKVATAAALLDGILVQAMEPGTGASFRVVRTP